MPEVSDSNVNSAARRGSSPLLWLLLGHKAGDNNQVIALADALGWPREEKRIFYRGWELLSNRLLGATLAGVDRGRSSPLQPPWPELVISSGRRNEPVARWIREQSANRTRIVHVGRPWAPIETFDLVISTPQYSLPERGNVLVNELPMHCLNSCAARAGRRALGEGTLVLCSTANRGAARRQQRRQCIHPAEGTQAGCPGQRPGSLRRWLGHGD